MGRVYTAAFTASMGTGSGGDDIIELVAGASNKCRIIAIEVYSDATTADAVTVRMLRRTTTGTGGTGATENPLNEDDSAATAAVSYNVTTPGTAGAEIARYEWEQLGPLVFIPTPQQQPTVDLSGRFCLELVDALAATQSISGYIMWEEE